MVFSFQIKATVFEGGVRVPACVFSPRLKDRFRVSDELFHITDWFPTLYKLAGGDLSKIRDLDGVDQWSTISDSQKSNRESLLVNIDEVLKPEAAISGNYKLVRGKCSDMQLYRRRCIFYYTRINV